MLKVDLCALTLLLDVSDDVLPDIDLPMAPELAGAGIKFGAMSMWSAPTGMQHRSGDASVRPSHFASAYEEDDLDWTRFGSGSAVAYRDPLPRPFDLTPPSQARGAGR